MAKGKGVEDHPAPPAEASEQVQVSREDLSGLLARCDLLERQVNELKSGVAQGANRVPPVYGLKEQGPLPAQTDAAQPAPPDPRHAIGTPGEGKTLWGVSLQGHKSRVVDRDREVAVLLATLPVWAVNKGEAEQEFKAYNGIVATIHPIDVVPMALPEAA